MLIIAMLTCFYANAIADNGEREIKIQDLPRNIMLFIESHFNHTPIIHAYTQHDEEHKVVLADGYEIEFDKDDRWEEIENELHAPLPHSVVGLLPVKATDYLAAQYRQCSIYSIERNRHEYEVKLHGSPNEELHFDHDGNLLQHKHDE